MPTKNLLTSHPGEKTAQLMKKFKSKKAIASRLNKGSKNTSLPDASQEKSYNSQQASDLPQYLLWDTVKLSLFCYSPADQPIAVRFINNRLNSVRLSSPKSKNKTLMKKFLSYPEETRRDIIQDVCVKLKPIYKKISFAVAWNIFQDINPQIEMLVPGLYNIPQLEKIKQELERLCN